MNVVWEEFAKAFNFKQVFADAYTPRTQGTMERAGGSLASLLNKLRHTRGDQWDRYLHAATRTINTRISPTRKVYFHRPHPAPEDYSDAVSDYDAFRGICRNMSFQAYTLPTAIERRGKAKAEARKRLDHQRSLRRRYPIDTAAMVAVPRVNKSGSRWRGPFEVSAAKGSSYTLKNCKGLTVARTVPHDLTKRAEGMSTESSPAITSILEFRTREGRREALTEWTHGSSKSQQWQDVDSVTSRLLLDDFDADMAPVDSFDWHALRHESETRSSATATRSSRLSKAPKPFIFESS